MAMPEEGKDEGPTDVTAGEPGSGTEEQPAEEEKIFNLKVKSWTALEAKPATRKVFSLYRCIGESNGLQMVL